MTSALKDFSISKLKETVHKQKQGYKAGGVTIPPCTVTNKGCWLSSKTPSNNGYIKVKSNVLRTSSSSKVEFYLHVCAYLSKSESPEQKECFIGMMEQGYQVSHLCHNKTCFNPDHLSLETGQVNRDRNVCQKLKVIKCECGTIHNPCPHEPKCLLS